MSRWTSTGNEISAGYRYIGYATNQQEATRIKDRHNAACDAYESRIAELEAELTGAYRGLHKTGTELLDARAVLARVKAESDALQGAVDRARRALGPHKPYYMCLNCDDYKENCEEENTCPDCGTGLFCDSIALRGAWEALMGDQ